MTTNGGVEVSAGERAEYVLDADRAYEQQRLIAQSRVGEPFLERALLEAGIQAGMHVLDLGSGAGDVALLAGRLVGTGGSVLGVERSAEAVELAGRRIQESGAGNVKVITGDVLKLAEVLDGGQRFDAVIGRLILMHVQDPTAVVRGGVEFLRPGGLLYFCEPDMTYEWVVPTSPLWEQVRTWTLETMSRAAVELRMGLKLHQTFRDAHVPAPELRLEALLASGESAPVFVYANLVRGMLPVMERVGVATAAELDVATLTDRLTAEIHAYDGLVLCPPLIHAWARIRGDSPN